MDFEVLRKRVEDVRSVRARREAAEKTIPRERLRREIREACAREDARDGEKHVSEPDTSASPEGTARPGWR